jgi:hypothetical protein
MSRFDEANVKADAARALAGDAETAQSRTGSSGGAPSTTGKQTATTQPTSMPKQRTREQEPPTSTTSAGMSFPVRLYITVDETDPLGKALAERVRLLPENMREHYSTNKAVRTAVLQSLGDIAKKL